MTILSAAPAAYAALMLLSALLMVGRMRLSSLVSLYRFQSFLLALIPATVGLLEHETHLLMVAVLVAIIKVVLIPMFLNRIGDNGSARLFAYAHPTTMTFAALALTLFSLLSGRVLVPSAGNAFMIGVSFSLLLTGILMLISRRDMLGQAMGFLVMESGIFLFGFALTGGMPLLVEIGVLFDLMAFFILVLLLMRRAHVEHASFGTDHLRQLID